MTYTLADLGWSANFSQQLSIEDLENLTPARVSEVHRTTLSVLTTGGPLTVGTEKTSTGDYAVGDWVLLDGDQIDRRLERSSALERRASGEDARTQLIAANVDTLFIVTSCNADFNPARLERYLVLAHSAGCHPVIVLTKSDMAEAEDYIRQAEGLQPMLSVLAVDARNPDQAAALTDWWGKGRTAAMVGSSGVGKSTLATTLTGQDVATAAIREDDAKGRHTTTARSLHRATHGGWLIDTPGMRALRLLDASDGIETVFSDLEDLAVSCKFRDCAHDTEPGCAIQAAIAAGTIDPARLHRWQKLAREDTRNSETLAQSRARGKSFGKMVKGAMSAADQRKGR
ncbi:MAG: ribosome small subunit-dependent GTPase A [Rhodobacteraceae bacterium]|nr:ribosome small subunit-dependent GTPase A [Paracoccaceae bacterium]